MALTGSRAVPSAGLREFRAAVPLVVGSEGVRGVCHAPAKPGLPIVRTRSMDLAAKSV
jgi:hypothetical protein